MQCPQCGASQSGPRCAFCGHTIAGPSAGAPPPDAAPTYGGGFAQPTAHSPEYQAAMGQPTAHSPEYQAAMGQPTAHSPEYHAAMGQPRSPYQQGSPMMMPSQTTMAKKGCCGCLSVLMLSLAASLFALVLALL